MKLKVTKRTGTHGAGQKVDWTGTEKEFSTIQMHTSGRGWDKMAILAFVDESPEFVEVEKCCEVDNKFSIVILKSHGESRVAGWTKKPYIRKTDGASYPNVETSTDVRKLLNVYGMSFDRSTWTKEEMRDVYAKVGGGVTHPLTFEQFCQPHFLVLTKELSE